MTPRVRALIALLLLAITDRAAFAQPPRDARLLVTVVDPTGAVIPGATVTVAGPDDVTNASARAPQTLQTSSLGLATVSGLAPGRYTVQAEFAGFETGVLKNVRLRSGDNKHVVVLPIKKLQDEVTVTRDAQEAASDRRGGAFGTALTREQIEALSDDPDEMQQQLMDMAGPGAVIRIDSFEGGKLPPKAQIKAIHITRDAFAAENHGAGGLFIDIITQPGLGPLRGGGSYRLRDGSFSGRSPFTPIKGPEQTQGFGGNLGGSLIKNRSSFSLFMNGTTSYETPNLNAALPGGTRSEALTLRTPRNNFFMNGLFDYAITKDQTLRVSYNQGATTQRNLGIGAYDLPERAYSSDEHFHMLRLQEAGPLGRRFFTNSRLQIGWSDTASTSILQAPTVHVLDAFTSGGQQKAGGRRVKTINLASDLDYVRGINSVRAGIVLEGGFYHSDETSNYLGTYTFESLAAFEAGSPRSYTRRIGNPIIDYGNLQAGAYVQDDIRIRKGLTISPGVRYEAQTHLADAADFGPRIGITWAPFKSGKTTLRASWGMFYDWLGSGTYEQTLRVDGFRQQELDIAAPSYPDPGNVGVIPPSSRYLLGGSVRMARTTRVSGGFDQTISSKLRLGAIYSHTQGSGLLRGLNLNPHIDGVRPDPAFANIVEVVSDASSRANSVNAFLNLSLSGMTPTPRSKQRWDWKRVNFGANYALGRSENNTDGAFSVPPGSLLLEWGPASNDVRQRMNAFFSTQALRNFSVNLNLSAASGSPYTIRTGRDHNGDLIFNDRPAGVSRNSARGEGSLTLNGFFIYTFSFGQRKVQLPPGIFINGGPGGFNVQTMQQDAARYRLSIVVNAQNLTNRTNYAGYSGTLTSPFFGLPTAVTGMRKVDVSLNFNF